MPLSATNKGRTIISLIKTHLTTLDFDTCYFSVKFLTEIARASPMQCQICVPMLKFGILT